MKGAARVALAGLCGAVIAWTAAALVLHTIFAAGGYTGEALVEPPPWSFGAVGLAGAGVGAGLAGLAGRVALPWWSRPAAVGGLIGVAAVVLPVAGIACPHPKGHPLQTVALVYGVPIGLVTGAASAVLWAGRRRAAPGTSCEAQGKGQ